MEVVTAKDVMALWFNQAQRDELERAGLVLVPKEPSAKMNGAGGRYHLIGMCDSREPCTELAAATYRAMISAALKE